MGWSECYGDHLGSWMILDTNNEIIGDPILGLGSCLANVV